MADPPEEPPEGGFGEPPVNPGGHYRDSPDDEYEDSPPGDQTPPERDAGETHAYWQRDAGETHADSRERDPVEAHGEPPYDPGAGYAQPPPSHDSPADDRDDDYEDELYGHGAAARDAPPSGAHERPSHHPGEGYGEPSHDPGEGYGEPPHDPGEGYGEPPYHPGEGYGEPPYDPGHDRGRAGEHPHSDSLEDRYERREHASHDPIAGSPLDHSTGELFDDDYDERPGDRFRDLGAPDEEAHASPRDLLGDLGEEVHSPSELKQRRAQERAARRRAGRQRLLALVIGLVVLVVIIVLLTGNGSTPSTSGRSTSDPLAAAGSGATHLAAGSAVSALPANILIADRNNNRLVAVTPQGQVVWSRPLTGPSDAFLSTTGRSLFVTEPGAFVVLRLGVADRRVSYSYGHSGRPGSSDNHLHDPETAQELPNGELVIADKSNCRILFIDQGSHHPLRTLGNPSSCVHAPPASLAFPDSVFPADGGGVVVTESDPQWVDVLNGHDAVVAALQVPGLTVPDDANEYAPGKLIATSHTDPGRVEEFDTADKVIWSYDPTSPTGELDRPSLAEVLPGGDVLVCDSGNDRVVVIDPQTQSIIWQYGHTHDPGARPGYLHTPDSAILVGAYSS